MKTNYFGKRLAVILTLLVAFGFSSYACSYKLKLYDTYGDGWNGGKVTVLVNGVAVLVDQTIASGYGPLEVYFTVSTGDSITTDWTAGSYPTENEYWIMDSLGTIYAHTGGGTNPIDITTPIIAVCPTPNDAGVSAFNSPPVPSGPGLANVMVTISNFGTATLSSATIGWSVDGVIQTPYSWTGTVAPFSTLDSVTIGSYTFSQGVHTIKAWTSSPNSATDGFAGNDSASFTMLYSSPLSGVYTIGGAGANFASFNAALTALTQIGVSGPVTFNVNNGTYNEQLLIPAILGASATNTITFKSNANNPDSVILQYSATGSVDNYTIKLNGADYFIFKNLTIKANGASYARVIDLTAGANYNLIESNKLYAASPSSSYSSCIYDGNTLNHYNTYLNNLMIGGYYTMYLYGVSSTSWEKGTVVQGNEIVGSYYYPIYSYYQDSIQIVGNYIHDGVAPYSYGIYTSYNMNQYRIVGNRVNIVATSTSICYGIRDYYSNYYSYNASASGYGLVANNMVSIVGGTGAHYGLYTFYNKGVEIYYNTINIAGGSTSGRAVYQYNTTSNTIGQTFKNNIFINTGGGLTVYYGTTAMVADADYNDYYTTGTVLAYWGANKATLTDLQTASMKDANSISVNAAFVSSTDLHNTAIATYQTATPLTAVTNDFDAQLRNASTPCMGADEYILYTNDAGITALTEPIAPCPGISTVKVNLKNFGIQSFTGVTVNWSVNGVAQTPLAYTSTLAAGAIEEVTLGTFNFLAGVVYNLTFSTSGPNSLTDQNTANDTLIVLGKQTAMSGTYTIGAGTGYSFNTITAAINSLKSFGVCGAVTFNIASGTYTENMNLTTIVGTSAVNTITFKSAANNKDSVIVQYAATGTADNFVVNLLNVNYIKLQHITFNALGASYGYVVNISSSNNNEITNCNLNTMVTTNSYFAGVYSTSPAGNYNIISNNNITGGYYGIYYTGVGSTSQAIGLEMENNSITDFYYYGIYSQYVDSAIINNNYIKNGLVSSIAYGLRSYYNDFTTITNNEIQISGTSSMYGLYLYYNYGDATTPVLVANNIVNIQGTSASIWYGVYNYASNYANFYHNSVNLNSGSTSSYAMYQSSGTYQNIVNNIFVHRGGGYALYVGTTSAITTSNNNVYNTTGTILAYWGAARTDLAALQLANSMDLASVQTNPVFANPALGNLIPLNITADNIGAIVGVLTDINGITRSTTTPDAGAIEFTGLTADLALISGSIKNGLCLSTSDSIFVKLSNVIGTTVNFATNPINIFWSVTGPVNSNDTISINAGSLNMGADSIFGAAGVNLSIPGVYTLNVYMSSNAVNTYAGNDTIYSAKILTVLDPFYVDPKYASAGPGDSIELSVRSQYFPAGGFFMSEICQFKGAASGWPTYLLSDDFIEITGVPNSDLGGITLEQWTGTAIASTYTFPTGTLLNSAGTAIIAVGEMGSSVPSPANFYYHGNGSYSSSWSSNTSTGRILKNASGTIIDAVGYAGYAFPASSNVTSADWSLSPTAGSGTAGIRLTGADNNTGSNWALGTQDPNVINSGVTAPSPSSLTGFTWTLNSVVTSTNVVDTIVGPYTTSGNYNYIANYTTACGLQSDTVFITAFVPAPLVLTNDTAICEGESITLSAQMQGTAPWTFIVTDGVYVDTVSNVMSAPFTYTVTPSDTTDYVVLKYWDVLNIVITANDTITIYTKSNPVVGMSTLADLCENASSVSLTGSPVGGVFSGVGVSGTTFDPAIAGVGLKTITYTFTGTNGCAADTSITVSVLDVPIIDAGIDQAICFGDSVTLTVTSSVKDPYFSEYQEGSSNHKIVEIYNGTGAALNMDNYAILTNANGSAWSGMYTFPLSTTIANGDVYVIANNAADTTLLNVADEALAYNAKGYMMAYNGDDVRALVKFEANGDTTIVDLIGLYNMTDPGSGWAVAGVANATVNHTLVRKPNAGPNYGNFAASQGTDSLTSDWLVYAQNTWNFTGSHTATSSNPVTSSFNILWSNSATTASTTVNPLTTTTYNVTVSDPVTTCSIMDSVMVTVHALPVVALGADYNLCENDMSTLDAGAGFAGYLWSNTATTQTINFYGYDLGVGITTIYAGVLDSNGCANVDSIDVTVLAAPVVNLGSDFTMKWITGMDTLDAGAGFTFYAWSNNWTGQTLVVSQTTNQIGLNTYWVVVTDANNCTGSDTIIITADDDTGLKGSIDLISVNIYPNPTSDNFFISMNGFTGKVQMEILDLTGKAIYSEALDIHNNFLKSVDVNTLAKGVYYLKLTTSTHSQMHKVVVQ